MSGGITVGPVAALCAAIAIAIGSIAALVADEMPADPAIAADVLLAFAGALATGLALRIWIDHTGTHRARAWRSAGLGAGCLALAGVWGVASEVIGQEPAPLGGPGGALRVVGLLLLAHGARVAAPHSLLEHSTRATLDGIIVGASVLFITYATALDQGRALSPLPFFATATQLVGILATAAFVTLVLQLATEPGRWLPRSVVQLLVVAATAAGAAEALRVRFTLEGLMRTNGITSALLCITVIGVGAAAIETGRSLDAARIAAEEDGVVLDVDTPLTEDDDDGLAKQGVATMVIPAIAVVLATAAACVEGYRGRITLPLAVMGGSLALLMLARQMVLIQDNLVLHHELEDRVDERVSAIAATERYFKSLVQNSSDVVVVIDADGRLAHISDSIEPVLGHRPAALLGLPFLDIIVPEDQRIALEAAENVVNDPGFTHGVTCEVIDADGMRRPVDISIVNLLADPEVAGVVCNLRDVTDQRDLQARLYDAAFNDHLTGLANRMFLLTRMEEAMTAAREHGRTVGLIYLDLDGFKQVNDTLGHPAGDDLLCEVARRLVAAVRPEDIVARIGGDEFAVLLEDVEEGATVGNICTRISHDLNVPYAIGGHSLSTRASLGAALSDRWAATGDELLRNADLAMYAGKQQGKGRVEHFRSEMLTAVQERAELEIELRRALDQGELVLHYQPLFDLRTDTISSMEALVRWQHPTKGLLGPMAFIPQAEQSELIEDLGRWALREACAALAQLSTTPQGSAISVAVNISGRHLQSTSLVNDVAGALLASKLDGSRLTIEVTETLLFDETPRVVQCLARLRKLRTKIAIDDFGTGYSSLSKLTRLPVDTLKLDGSFVHELSTSPAARAVMTTVVELGRNLGLSVVAEGIGDAEKLDLVRAAGVGIGQGFHLMRPAPFADIVDLLSGADRVSDILS